MKSWNNLKSNELAVDQELRVKGPSKKKSKRIKVNEKGWHVVEKGETLYSISRLYGMSVDQLIAENNLKSNAIDIGMKLKVDERSSNKGKTYTVKKGDTLYSIAKKFDLSVEDLKKKNKLSSNELNVGQRLEVE